MSDTDNAYVIRWCGPGNYRSDMYYVAKVGEPKDALGRDVKHYGPATQGECEAFIANTNQTTGELVMNPGTVLPNGWVVVAASARNAHEWVLLAMRTGFHASDPYATWVCKRPGDGADTMWGHYFDSLGDAVEDFYARSGVDDEVPHLG